MVSTRPANANAHPGKLVNPNPRTIRSREAILEERRLLEEVKAKKVDDEQRKAKTLADLEADMAKEQALARAARSTEPPSTSFQHAGGKQTIPCPILYYLIQVVHHPKPRDSNPLLAIVMTLKRK